ncbi:MAG TPA: type II toxin-antitoxin system VapC family toxin [Casimicrobiaceae bacterium]|nr:type II toxin-antitoxin system VapC family toxin [Casimicrobiaceae bacterium]
MPVLDASMALSWLFERETASERRRSVAVLDSLEDLKPVVPALWQAEILNGLLVGERRGLIAVAQSMEYLARLGELPVETDDVSPVTRRELVLELGRRHRLSAYDASYLELAMRVGGPLATFDRDLAKAATAAGIEVR